MMMKYSCLALLVTFLLSSWRCFAGRMLFWDDVEPLWELEDNNGRDGVAGVACGYPSAINPYCEDCASICKICTHSSPTFSETNVDPRTGDSYGVSNPGLGAEGVGIGAGDGSGIGEISAPSVLIDGGRGVAGDKP